MASDEMNRYGEELDRMDGEVTKVLAANPWPWKHPSNWLSQREVSEILHEHHEARVCYYGTGRSEWMGEVSKIAARRPSLTQLWQRWRDVVAARKEVARVGEVTAVIMDDDFTDVGIVPTRQRIDAMLARDRLEGIYDMVLRVFEGRAPYKWSEWTFENHFRVRKPSKAPPATRTIKSPTGYVKTGKYEMRPDGVKVPIVRKQ